LTIADEDGGHLYRISGTQTIEQDPYLLIVGALIGVLMIAGILFILFRRRT
jgi:LPXTG-motif cell wall-anchored protein